jgi:hypothetical protein
VVLQFVNDGAASLAGFVQRAFEQIVCPEIAAQQDFQFLSVKGHDAGVSLA